ncbi:hypothetical protein [Acidovorax sp. FJL06]|uniref:hypothetical protein n=1 Tax=Acidovorax sp. FJL06 TaxID=2153365 RepID=UPI000F589B4D|nr:hypothetical protein [Acidovorax sp. FJL06]
MKRVLSLCMTVLVTGCAFSPVDKPVAAKHVSQDKLWQVKSKDTVAVLDATKVALESAGYETASTTPELGELKTKPKQLPIPEHCDCGTWNSGVVQGSAQSVLVATFKTQPNDEGALKISHGCATTFMGRNLYGAVTTQETYVCASRGQTESDVSQRIEAIFKARGIALK